MHYLKLLFKATIIVAIFFYIVSCSSRDTEPFKVTYKSIVLTNKPVILRISYKDSTDYVRFTTRDKNWSKDVTLAPNDIASLLICVSYDWTKDLEQRFYEFPEDIYANPNPNPNLVMGKIIPKCPLELSFTISNGHH